MAPITLLKLGLETVVKILMVDDEDDLLEVLGASFEGMGLEFESASNGSEAIEKFGKFKPDVVLTDYNMPHMNGLELTKKLKGMQDDVKVFLYTGNDCIDDEDRGLFHKIFSKPLLSIDVINSIKDLVE